MSSQGHRLIEEPKIIKKGRVQKPQMKQKQTNLTCQPHHSINETTTLLHSLINAGGGGGVEGRPAGMRVGRMNNNRSMLLGEKRMQLKPIHVLKLNTKTALFLTPKAHSHIKAAGHRQIYQGRLRNKGRKMKMTRNKSLFFHLVGAALQ